MRKGINHVIPIRVSEIEAALALEATGEKTG
jgi:hypothetical protein